MTWKPLLVVGMTCAYAAGILQPPADKAGNTDAPATPPTASQPSQSQPAASQPDREAVVIRGEEFRLELALDTASRGNGLSGRSRIEPGGGMLFVFPRAEPLMFWMADCLTDIDLLYVNQKGFVVGIHRMKKEPPQRSNESRDQYLGRLKAYRSRTPCQFVVELEPGAIDRLGVRIGDKVDFNLEKLVKRAK